MNGKVKAAIGVAMTMAGVAGAGGTAVADAGAAGRPGQVLFHDEFRDGFDSAQTWQLGSSKTATGAVLPQGDGVITAGRRGITVVPTGTNPVTGRPAFAATTDQNATGFGGGTGDHLKWVAQPRQSSANGVPVPDTGALVCSSQVSVRSDYVDQHPFGRAVSDPQTDPRLASATLISVDHTTHTVANLTVTNGEIHAVYERLPIPGSTYASYHYSVPVAKRTPGRTDDLQIKFDQGGRRVTWLVNGRNVLSTDRIGTPAFDRKYLRLDHGGTPEQVRATSVQCGLGTGNLLDGAGGVRDRDKRGLVRLGKEENFYYKPSQGAPAPQTFLDDRSLEQNRLWGQGVTLKVRSFDMRYVR
ncbi:DUF6081 family protein [Kitasatospora sp. NPDC002965]|uniref:DUF6081 family protein n=1 Tax=unclassified Kitasatospora TaxID=2633591 RepID=UPI0033B1064C